MWQRIIFTVFLLIFLIFLPFWIYLPFAVLGIFYFNFYIEAFIVFLVSDLLYGIKIDKLFNLGFFQSSLVLFIFILGEFIKRNTRFYKKEND